MAEQSPFSLAGKRVIITRPELQSTALAASLRAAGADVILLPLIRIEPPLDAAPLDSVLRKLSQFDWLIFTSQNAVAGVANRFAVLGAGTEKIPATLKVAAVGKTTADAAAASGFSVARTGEGRTASDLVHALAGELSGKRVLLPRSDRADPALVAQLQKAGADVTEIVAYRTVAVHYSRASVVDRADAILFFSPSAVHAFSVLLKSGVFSSPQSYGAIGAIGPVTRTALLDAALPCDFEAQHPSAEEIVLALAAHLEKKVIAPGVHSR